MPSWLSWSAVREGSRTSVWPLPVLALVVALSLGVALPRLDAAIDDDLPATVRLYLFGGGAGAARTVLDAIATSLISVTSLTFSLTVVTLQLASSQYSPRLLRTFTRDRFVHSTLALFLGSFVYALTVLRTVRTLEDGQDAFVPQVSVTVAFALALASVLGLVLFLAHLAREIRVETILHNVHQDSASTIARVLEPRQASESSRRRPPDGVREHPSGSETLVLLAHASGFLVATDVASLRAAASGADAVVVIDTRVGDALTEGTPVGRAWPCSPGRALTAEAREHLQEKVSEALVTHFERTEREDVAFGLRQLVDVAVKALSPGVNDPTTAVHALNHLSALLCELLQRDLMPRAVCDEAGAVRVLLAQHSFGDLLDLAVCQPRIFGATDPYVMTGLLELLRAVAFKATTSGDRDAIAAQLACVRRSIDRSTIDAPHLEQLAHLESTVSDALYRR